jgi:hypothetical protein
MSLLPHQASTIAEISLEAPATGTYYLVIFEPHRGGPYGLDVGYEERFGLEEWILIPIFAIGIHEWEGQSIAFILVPMELTLIVGFGSFFGSDMPQRRPSLA